MKCDSWSCSGHELIPTRKNSFKCDSTFKCEKKKVVSFILVLDLLPRRNPMKEQDRDQSKDRFPTVTYRVATISSTNGTDPHQKPPYQAQLGVRTRRPSRFPAEAKSQRDSHGFRFHEPNIRRADT